MSAQQPRAARRCTLCRQLRTVPLSEIPALLVAGLADRYSIERELGRGGMATVYLAHDLKHKRSVALKVLHPELAATLGPQRFQREIEIAARLQHPHILSVHDSGETAGYLWFTMPLVEGESLRDRLRREVQLPVDEAVRIVSEAARALDYAHRHEVIHRDIKPENILVTTDGDTLVADFGIARALGGAGPGAPGSTGATRLTETGTSIGTPAYMSPEQASGDKHVDARSDVYSLGIVLYEMLAGEPPFTGPTAQAVIAKRFAGPAPRVRTARPSVPESVEQAVAQALALTPADRFATAADFVRALAASSAVASTGSGGTTPTVLSRAATHPRLPLGLATLLVGLLVGVGILFAWRSTRRTSEVDANLKVLAVLPFENLGDSADAYFADGVANDLRTKLSQVAGLSVIARASSNEYRHSPKQPQQIARELGADYLLTATVQWDKVTNRTSRVRVTPELVEVQSGQAPRARWGQAFDAPLSDVFQVQGDIASKVMQALHVTLGDSVKRELAMKPTQHLPAYDAFLRGEAASQGMSTRDPRSLRQAIDAYEQAVALDSAFALAWAQLARAHATLFLIGNATPAGAEAARHAAMRALSLAANEPEGHQALGAYYANVPPGDPNRAYAEDSTALALAPGNAGLLAAVGWDELILGRWEAARKHLEHAARLDPRSGAILHQLGELLLLTRQYPDAERVLDRALHLLPSNLGVRTDRATVALAEGDLPHARAVINAAPKEVNPTALVAFVATYEDLMWVLDEGEQQLLMRLPPSAFDGDLGIWAIVLAQTYALRGNGAKARVYADSARRAFEQVLLVSPQDAQRHAMLGLALAYMGRKAEAIAEGNRGVALLPISRNAYLGPYVQHQLARIYLLVGEPEKALDQLEQLLKVPHHLSPGWLRIDPTFDPLRGNPRFERMLEAKS